MENTANTAGTGAPKQQIVERLKQANNVLVTVSNNPSVDQLSAAIGLTLFLNKLNKHATAVFSGQVPSTIEFLHPEKTIEKNTDSLRDFIIALDKSKADKLRYKVEDEHVKIFITPYRTSISQEDLEFSQGDFNVDVVIGIGVQEQRDLDQAITAHGRILHDATVMTIATVPGGSLGSINWVDDKASSLSEMLVSILDLLKPNELDGQIATAFLTGIVAVTERFSNDKTTSATMSISAKLMTAGANQQLVAAELQPKPEPVPEPAPLEQAQPADVPAEGGEPQQPVADAAPAPVPQPNPDQTITNDGALHINHMHDDEPVDETASEDEKEPPLEQIHIDESGEISSLAEANANAAAVPGTMLPQPEAQLPQDASTGLGDFMTAPPTTGGMLTAAGQPDDEPSTDPMSTPTPENGMPLLSHDAPLAADYLPTPSEPQPQQAPASTPVTSAVQEESHLQPEPEVIIPDTQTLSDLEHAVESPHTQGAPVPSVPEARDAVSQAANLGGPLPPVAALNARPLDMNVQQHPMHEHKVIAPDPGFGKPVHLSLDEPGGQLADAALSANPMAPPPVPPPLMPTVPAASPLADDATTLPPIGSSIQPQVPPQSNTNNPFGLPPA